jgi:ankyrin repeat protein
LKGLIRGHDGNITLHEAAKTDQLTVQRLLLGRRRLDPNIKDGAERTPLFWTVECGNLEVAQLLLKLDDVNPESEDGSGRTPLSYDSARGDVEVVKYCWTVPT